jgi:hypothetical protein
MRRSFVVIVFAVVLGISAAAAARSQVQANQQAARRDARQLVGRLQLPASARHIRAEPRFASSLFGSLYPGCRCYAKAQAWWTITGVPHRIIAYVRRHPPAGSTLDIGTGSSRDSKTGVTAIDVQFSWPDVPSLLLNRVLTVTVITPPHGNSVLVAQSESAWFVPRPRGEQVPGGVHVVAITLRLGPPATGPVVRPGGRVHTTMYLVRRPARVRALVRTVDTLAIVQPSIQPLGCPMILTGSSASELTLAFKTSSTGTTLARAQVYVRRGAGAADGADPCSPINFWIHGRQQTALTSPSFVREIGKLIGADIS